MCHVHVLCRLCACPLQVRVLIFSWVQTALGLMPTAVLGAAMGTVTYAGYSALDGSRASMYAALWPAGLQPRAYSLQPCAPSLQPYVPQGMSSSYWLASAQWVPPSLARHPAHATLAKHTPCTSDARAVHVPCTRRAHAVHARAGR